MSHSHATWRLSRVLMVLVGIFALASCAQSPWKRNMIRRGPGFAIYKERKFDDSERPLALGLAHPAVVDPHVIKTALANIAFTRSGFFAGQTPKLIYRPIELEELSTAISDELGALTPDERLRFLTLRSEGLAFMQGRAASSAVVFAPTAGSVEIAFDLVLDSAPSDDDSDPASMRFYDDPTGDNAVGFILHVPAGLSLVDAPSGENRVIFETEVIAAKIIEYEAREAEVSKASATVDEAKRPGTSGAGPLLINSGRQPEPGPKPQAAPTTKAGPKSISTPTPTPTPTPGSAPEPAPKITPGPTPAGAETPRVMFPYKGFVVVTQRQKFAAVPGSVEDFDAKRFAEGGYKSAIERDSVEGVIGAVDELLETLEQLNRD